MRDRFADAIAFNIKTILGGSAKSRLLSMIRNASSSVEGTVRSESLKGIMKVYGGNFAPSDIQTVLDHPNQDVRRVCEGFLNEIESKNLARGKRPSVPTRTEFSD
jgi:hypothetical protein